MATDVRELLAEAAAAEARGDVPAAISSLTRAAEVYRDAKNSVRALKLRRHIRRLQGESEDDEASAGGDVGATAWHEHAETEADPERSDELPTRRPRQVLAERVPTLADASLGAWCSFCCRPTDEVGALVAAPTGCFICRSCLGLAGQLLGEQATTVPAGTPHPAGAFVPLAAQRHAWEKLSRPGSRLTLLLGPAGSGRTSLLASAGEHRVRLDVEAPLTTATEDAALSAQRPLVVAVRALAPSAALTLEGPNGVEALYDTPSLVKACRGVVSEELLARVDVVAVLPALDAEALLELARRLAQARSVELADEALRRIVGLAQGSSHEVAALIARIPSGTWGAQP